MQQSTQQPVTPWYRQLWPWLLMLMPALAVVGGFITLWFALSTNNAMVVDDYYKEGKAINLELARDREAAQRGLDATIASEGGGIVVRLAARNGSLPPFVTLRVVHATRAELDRTFTLARTDGGVYAAPDGQLPGPGRWNLLVEDPERTWRLTAAAEGFAAPVRLGGAP